jgi:hypothetical protein
VQISASLVGGLRWSTFPIDPELETAKYRRIVDSRPL